MTIHRFPSRCVFNSAQMSFAIQQTLLKFQLKSEQFYNHKDKAAQTKEEQLLLHFTTERSQSKSEFCQHRMTLEEMPFI